MIRIALHASGGDQTTDAPIGEVLDANIVLKFYESAGRMVRTPRQTGVRSGDGASESMARLTRFLDYSSYDGAPLVGVRGVPIVCHRRSSARAIQNAIRVAATAVENHLTHDVGEELAFGATA